MNTKKQYEVKTYMDGIGWTSVANFKIYDDKDEADRFTKYMNKETSESFQVFIFDETACGLISF